VVVSNDCHCCAERKLIRSLKLECNRKGVPIYNLGSYFHRKYGELVIHRPRRDGIDGKCLPCVLCRREMDRYGLKWIAYDGEKWVHSARTVDIPKGHLTSRQKNIIFSS
jgi:hypothetical protein